jgi:Transglutaminase-like superfamily
MKHFFKKILPLIFCCLTAVAFGQKFRRDFTELDTSIKKLGTLDSMNMGNITQKVTKNLIDKADMARAIFDWIAYNINFDIKAAQNGNTEKNSSTEVLLYRKATAAGYANLFQDMCSSAGIRCLTVDGYVKNTPEQIGQTKTAINHSWAVVQLGLSPDAWYFVDPCWGSGYADAEFKSFTKAFTPGYFFADLNIFNTQHYPDNQTWYIGQRLKSKKEFFDFPLVKSAAYEFGLKRFSPREGSLTTKAGSPLYFSFQLSSNITVNKVAVMYGEGKSKKVKDTEFTMSSSGLLSFSYKFEEEDSLPVTILVNGKQLVAYTIEVK